MAGQARLGVVDVLDDVGIGRLDVVGHDLADRIAEAQAAVVELQRAIGCDRFQKISV